MLIEGDSGDTTTDTAVQTVTRELAESVDAIVGAASSSVSASVIDQITEAGVTQFSPANTSKQFSDYPDEGLYFRLGPSDILQGQVLAEVIADDGHGTLVILNFDDDYGNGLAEDLAASFTSPAVRCVDTITYDPQAQTFDAEVGQAAATDADALALIGFEESSRVLAALVEAGFGPLDIPTYLRRRQHRQRVRRALRRRRVVHRAGNGSGRKAAPVSAVPAVRLPGLGQGAEVELDDLGVVEELVAGAGVGVAALVEHVAAVADLQAAAGVLLDHHDRHAGVVDLPAADEHLVLEARATGRPTARRAAAPTGRIISARPMATIWRSPPDSDPARCLRRCAEQREQLADLLEALVEACGPLVQRPSARFSSTVSRGNTLLFWGTYPTPLATRAWALVPVMSSPRSVTVPAADRHQAEQRLEQRRLAGAVRADDADELALEAGRGCSR